MIYIHNTETGQIVQKIDCPDEHAEHYERDGCSVVVTDQNFDLEKTYIAGGKFVGIPDRPGEYHDWSWATQSWVLNTGRAAVAVRTIRDRLLAASDWTDTISAQQRLMESDFSAWATYRQALRDITDQAGFPIDVVWPAPPKGTAA